MLLQLQGTLANITRRKDELLDACLEYELESSERVRALAQELQRERVSVPADPVEAIARWKPHAPPDMDWEEEMEKAEELQLEFPGWEFLIRASASAPGLSTPEGTSQAPPSTRKFLPSSSSPGDREAQRVATAKSTTSSTQQSTRSKEDLAAQSSYPPKGLKATANANGKQPAQPASVRQSSSSSALLVHSGGLFSRQSVSKMRSGNGTSQSLVHHSASTPAALNTQGRTTPALPTHDLQASATRVDAKPGAKGAGKTLAASIPVPGEKCASERLLQGLVAYSPVAEAACRAGCNDAREAGQLCLHLLLLSLIAELADQLALEDNVSKGQRGKLRAPSAPWGRWDPCAAAGRGRRCGFLRWFCAAEVLALTGLHPPTSAGEVRDRWPAEHPPEGAGGGAQAAACGTEAAFPLAATSGVSGAVMDPPSPSSPLTAYQSCDLGFRGALSGCCTLSFSDPHVSVS